MRVCLHEPTLEAVIEALFQSENIGDKDEAIRLVDSMRPPAACVTMGDLFSHVDRHEDAEEVFKEVSEEEDDDNDDDDGEADDGCEICGVRCWSTSHAPYPGLCVRCTAKVQQLHAQKGGKAPR